LVARSVTLVPRARQNLPGVYAGLTITAQLWRNPGRNLPPGQKAVAMRIVGPNASSPTAAPAAPRRTSAGGFSVAEQSSPASPAPVASLRTIGGIDALIALQGQDDPAEKRRRAVKRGRVALDALDELKAEVLAGTLGPSILMRLKSAGTDLRDTSGDAGLDAVLAEIDLRLAVEIAKISPPK
jgi:hypothetical protein